MNEMTDGETMYLTENQVINLLSSWLTTNAWRIEGQAFNRDHGVDLIAARGLQRMLVEAKGARGNPTLQGVVRPFFDRGQLKDHLGKAIVKALELKTENPDCLIVIAQPSTENILEISKTIVHHLTKINIGFAFVGADGRVDWIMNDLQSTLVAS